MVWIGYEVKDPFIPVLSNTYQETIYIKAKDDSQAYEKALKTYYKIKKEFNDRNPTDTILLDIHEGDYIHGVNVFYEKEYLKLTRTEKLDIEKKVLEMYNQNKLDE